DEPGREREQPGVAARVKRVSHQCSGRQRRAQSAAVAAGTTGFQQGASEGAHARIIARHAPVLRCRRRAAERARQVSASMKRSIFVAILGLFLVGGVARGTAPASFAVLPGIYCTYQFITYEAGGYRSQGTCELTALTSLDYPNKHAPWGAVGTYDPSTREATESFDVGVSEADNNFYFGGIASWMSCSKDPWLNDVRDCRVEKVSTFGNIPQDVADSAMRKHGRPLTADLTPGQRATLQREYHARHFNGATPAQAAQVERVIPQNQTPQ